MKVCFLGPFWSRDVKEFLPSEAADILDRVPGMGGYSVSALVRLRLLRGLPTEVITLDPRIDRVAEFRGDLLKYTICPRRSRGLSRSLYGREVRSLREAIARSDADVIHANWAYEYSLAAVGAGRPCLVTVRDHAGSILRRVGWTYFPNYLITRYVIRHASHLSAVSPYNAEFVRRVTTKEVRVVPNCASPACLELGSQLFDKAPLFASGLIIASAIGAVDFKNPRKALEAFSLVRQKNRDARYRLMGPGLADGDEIARWARARGFDEGVEFLGNRSHDDVLKVFAESSIILHPSLEEACSNTVVEAMALGKPIVAGTSGGGTPWVLDGGRAGLLVDVRSAAEMANAMRSLYADRNMAQRLARQAFDRARSSFSPEAVLQGYEQLYKEILDVSET